MPWSHVACCVDRDDRARAVADLARGVATESGARLTVVHGAPRPLIETRRGGRWGPSQDDPAVSARAWLDALAEDVGAESEIITGTTAEAVCAWAELARPDLLVVGASRGALARATSGGFAAHLAYHAPCHVLVVRPTAGGREGFAGNGEAR